MCTGVASLGRILHWHIFSAIVCSPSTAGRAMTFWVCALDNSQMFSKEWLNAHLAGIVA